MILIPSMYDANRFFLIREDRSEISFYIEEYKIVRESLKLKLEEIVFIHQQLIPVRTYESKINPKQ